MRVSRRCCSGLSLGPSAAAMPPCAQRVEPVVEQRLGDEQHRQPGSARVQHRGEPGEPGPDDDDVGRRSSRARGASRRRASRFTSLTRLVSRSARATCHRAPAPAAPRPGRCRCRTIRLSASTKTTCGWRVAGLGVVHDAVRDEDDEVAGVHQPGGRAVDADDAGAARPGDDVRLQPGAVGDVDDRDLLARRAGRRRPSGPRRP